MHTYTRVRNYHFLKDLLASLYIIDELFTCYLLFGDRIVEIVDICTYMKKKKMNTRACDRKGHEDAEYRTRLVIADEKPGAVCETYLSQTASSDIQYS